MRPRESVVPLRKTGSAEEVLKPKMLDKCQMYRESTVFDNQMPVEIDSSLLEAPADDPSQIPSYPTRSLNFLNALHKTEGSVKQKCQAIQPNRSALALNVLVVGAGLGGLAAGIALARKGHAVTIFEQAPQMGEVRPSEFYMAAFIADSMVDWCRHTNTAKFKQAALTMGPGAFTRWQSCRARSYNYSTLERWHRHWLYELDSPFPENIWGSILCDPPGSFPRINAKAGQEAWCQSSYCKQSDGV